MANKHEITIRKVSSALRGSCNFCNRKVVYVYEVQGEGGTQVRICTQCKKEIAKAK
jgi:hypothetical protein